MPRLLLLLFLLLGAEPATVWAQASAADSCGCRRNFDQMVSLIEANYAGYHDKVTPRTRPRLDSLTAAVRTTADTTQAEQCGVVLYKWLTFFRDGHLALINEQVPMVDTAAIRARYATWERLPWTRASFRRYLDDPTRPKEPLEGIWSDGGPYEAGIVAAGVGQYKAFLLRADSVWWMPGQVKFTLSAFADSGGRAVYYMRDHSARRLSFDAPAARQGVLRLAGLSGAWYRQYPAPVAVPARAQSAPLHSFRMLDDTTALYRLGSFDGSYRSFIDSLTKAHAADLRRTRLLILDLRNNGGGSDGSYRSLEPLLYTGPVRTVGVALWSTEENNRKYDGQMYPNMAWWEKLYFAHLKRRLEAHRGQFVAQRSGSVERVERGRRRPVPVRVAILQNRNVASTTEQFVLLARQSQKTTLFGENSAGVLDYANMHFVALPCYNLRLGWATSRSYRIDRGEGVDNVGIAPYVLLDPAAPDLVERVQAWYRRPH